MLPVRGPSYALCNQTVTVYHREGEGGPYRRVVITGAYLEYRDSTGVDKAGEQGKGGFLLVLPQGAGGMVWLSLEACAAREDKTGCYTLAPNDKVFDGAGPEIADRAAWAAFHSGKVGGVFTVRQVQPFYWNGQVCHVEVTG